MNHIRSKMSRVLLSHAESGIGEKKSTTTSPSILPPHSYLPCFRLLRSRSSREDDRTSDLNQGDCEFHLKRGFQENSDKIQINTDFRSHKIEDLKHCSYAEIYWYFTDSWEQFRINGSVDIIDGSNPDPMKLQESLEAHDEVSKGKYTIGLGQDCMAFCTEVEDVISMRFMVKTGGLDALDVLNHMKMDGTKPDIVCYTTVLDGVIAKDDYAKADQVFVEMLVLGLVA